MADEQVAQAFKVLLGAESDYRQHDDKGNPLTSPKGAVGIAQVMPATAREAATLAGLEWDEEAYLHDADYNAKLGQAYFEKQVQANGGDLAKAFAAYNAGPGALARAMAKGGKDWLTLLPKETQDYVTKNMGALGQVVDLPAQDPNLSPMAAPTTQGDQPEAPVSLGGGTREVIDRVWDSLAASRSVDQVKVPTTPPGPTGDAIQARISTPSTLPSERVEEIARREQAWRDGVAWLDKVERAYDDTFIPSLLRSQERPDNNPDPSFDVMKAYREAGGRFQDSDDAARLLGSRNEKRFYWEVAQLDRRDTNRKYLGAGSLGGTLTATLAAGAADPMTWITGVAGMKAAALAGKTGYTYYALGGAAGNVGYDTVRAAAGADVSAMDVAAGALLGAGLGMAGYRLGGAAEAAAAAQYKAAAKALADARAENLDAAAKELGPGATPEQVSQRADEIQRAQVGRIFDVTLAPVDADKHLVPTWAAGERQPQALSGPDDAAAPRLTQGEGAVPAEPDVLPPEPGRLATAARKTWEFIRGPKEPTPDPDGLDFVTPTEVREALRGIMHQARRGVAANPIDESRLRLLTEAMSDTGFANAARNAFGSAGLKLLRSDSEVARWFAMQALENTSGAFRTTTAAITKYQLEHLFMGDVKNQLDVLFHAWRASQGRTGKVKEFMTDQDWREFSDRLFRYREGVRNGIRITAEDDPIVKQAADLLTRQYDMMRRAQIRTRVAGFGNLPPSSEGYNPWRISPRKWAAMSPAKQRAYARALAEEVQAQHGWDPEFAMDFARTYVDRVSREVNASIHMSAMPGSETQVEILEAALKARGLSEQDIQRRLSEFTRGGAKQTRSRVERNLLTPYDDGEGGVFTLMDIMETDPAALLQQQARSVSGQVSLAQYGVSSRAELNLIREAIRHQVGLKDPKTLEAFDQTVAELLGTPFRGETPQWVDNLRAMTSVVQLGGMGWAQLSEFGNAVATFGVAQTLKAVPSFGRLLAEVRTLARGGTVKNSLLDGFDEMTGNMGLSNYRNTFAHQMGDVHQVTYGRDSIGTVGKMIRGGQYLQGKLSFWRAIHAVQERMVTEMAINKGLSYILKGKDTAALRDMGIGPDLAARLRKELDKIATFDKKGQVLTYDPAKGTDHQAIKEFHQAVTRGVKQVIQGTFAGEQGKWAHEGFLKFLTQFRTYSIVSVEKQIMRQMGNYGNAKALGILLGSISVSAPIVALRALSSALLMKQENREEYLFGDNGRLTAANLGIAAMGYTAIGGALRDMLDVGGSALGYNIPGSPRTPKGQIVSGFIPGVSLVEDVLGGLSDLAPHWDAEGNFKQPDPTGLLRTLPFGRTPFLLPMLQGLTQD